MTAGGGWSSVPNWVVRSPGMSGSMKLTYIALLNRANDAGECWPSLDTLEADVGASRGTVITNLKKLEAMGLLERERRVGPDGGNTSNLYRVNVWAGTSKGGAIPAPPSSTKNLPPGSILHPPSANENLEERPSETNTDEVGTAVAVARPDVDALLDLFDDELRKNGVTKMPSRGKSNTDAMRLMIDRDGRKPEDIARAIRWAQADSFWRSNVMCAAKLRERYEQLQLAARKTGATSAGSKAVALANEMRAQREGGSNPWAIQ